jgi:Tol biopolymer transport system component
MAGIASGRRWIIPTVAALAVLFVIVVVLSRMLAPSSITITASNIRAVTSEPGMEWQPALSPDGSQVAFVARRGDRHSVVIRSTLNIGGGEGFIPVQGLQEPLELFPAWSPDGEFVRFWNCPSGTLGMAGRRMPACPWREVAKLGGSVRPVDLGGSATSTAWSPDGSRVAFIRNWRIDSIFAYSVSDGTTTLLAVPVVQREQHSLVWSPDGRRIAYVDGNSTSLFSFDVNVSSIWIVNADGGEPVQVTGDDFMDVSPAWLDDDHLLFISNRDGLREVYVVEVGATGPRGEPWKVPGVIDPHSISYSIAGRKLAFSKTNERQNIWSYPIGSGPMSIRDGDPVTSENAVIESHDISPDGRWITYNSNLRGNTDIYKKRLDGGSPVQITDSPMVEFRPRWSPDGTEIAFIRVSEAGAGRVEWEVMVVPAGGGTPSQVVGGTSGSPPTWSPSGLDIAFGSYRTGQHEAWIVSRETVGGPWVDATQLTDFVSYARDWTPDGSGVLCMRPLPSPQMLLVSREGEVFWRFDLWAAGLRRWGSPHPRFSRDGSAVYLSAYHEDGSGGIWAIPLHGGEPSLVLESAEFMAPSMFSVGRDRLYVTVAEHESDIWVMDVEVER